MAFSMAASVCQTWLATAFGSSAAPVPENLKPAACRYFVEKPGGDQQGPLDIADLQKLLNAGLVTTETPVFREGDEEWLTLGAFISSGSQ